MANKLLDGTSGNTSTYKETTKSLEEKNIVKDIIDFFKGSKVTVAEAEQKISNILNSSVVVADVKNKVLNFLNTLGTSKSSDYVTPDLKTQITGALTGAIINPSENTTPKTTTAGTSRFTVTGGVIVDNETGNTYNIDYSKVQGPFKQGTMNEVDLALQTYFNLGRVPTLEDMKAVGYNRDGNAWKNVLQSVTQVINTNGLQEVIKSSVPNETPNEEVPGENPDGTIDVPEDTYENYNPQESAFNSYYNDLYSLKKGTGGREMLDQLGQVYMNQAQNEKVIANVNFQTQALQQAQTVKAITDQVRAERMARLRAGMSESQIANQDMQMMMANVNTLNQNAQAMNQARVQAQMNQNAAQDQAYLAYLEQANARGQNAAAMYAADSGNSVWAAEQYAKKAGVPYKKAYETVTNTGQSTK